MTDSRRPVTEEQVAHVYRALAEEFARERARTTSDRTWARLSRKLEDRARRTWRQRLSASFLSLAARLRGAVEVSPLFALWARPTMRFGMGLAAVAALLTGGLLWMQRTADLRFEVVGGQVNGGWVQSQEAPVLLEFSDGSELQLRGDSLLNVSVVGRRSALTRISKGDVRVDVRHADATDWRFFAGPFEVRVVGTKFDLGWHDERLTIAMREGTVRIVGPEREWTLRAGERLDLQAPKSVAHAAVHNGQADSAPVVETQDEHPGLGAPTEALPKAVRAPGIGVRAKQDEREIGGRRAPRAEAHRAEGAAVESWSQLLARGEFAAVVNQARDFGIDSTLQSRSSDELVALAQAARYSKDSGLARRVWQGIRSRFSGSASARDAVFFLGRIDDQTGQSQAALEAYATYLRESGHNGPYAREAMGRRLVILRQSNPGAAAEEARTYLAQFPSGSYAKLAQDIIAAKR